jgi:hypothetical protein
VSENSPKRHNFEPDYVKTSFEILATVTRKVARIWDMAPRNLV